MEGLKIHLSTPKRIQYLITYVCVCCFLIMFIDIIFHPLSIIYHSSIHLCIHQSVRHLPSSIHSSYQHTQSTDPNLEINHFGHCLLVVAQLLLKSNLSQISFPTQKTTAETKRSNLIFSSPNPMHCAPWMSTFT